MSELDRIADLHGRIFKTSSGNVCVYSIIMAAGEGHELRLAIHLDWGSHPSTQDLIESERFVRGLLEGNGLLGQKSKICRQGPISSPEQLRRVASQFVQTGRASDPAMN